VVQISLYSRVCQSQAPVAVIDLNNMVTEEVESNHTIDFSPFDAAYHVEGKCKHSVRSKSHLTDLKPDISQEKRTRGTLADPYGSGFLALLHAYPRENVSRDYRSSGSSIEQK
jgi:hypothetical protein